MLRSIHTIISKCSCKEPEAAEQSMEEYLLYIYNYLLLFLEQDLSDINIDVEVDISCGSSTVSTLILESDASRYGKLLY